MHRNTYEHLHIYMNLFTGPMIANNRPAVALPSTPSKIT